MSFLLLPTPSPGAELEATAPFNGFQVDLLLLRGPESGSLAHRAILGLGSK